MSNTMDRLMVELAKVLRYSSEMKRLQGQQPRAMLRLIEEFAQLRAEAKAAKAS